MVKRTLVTACSFSDLAHFGCWDGLNGGSLSLSDGVGNLASDELDLHSLLKTLE